MSKLEPPCRHCPFRARYHGERDYLRPGRRLEIVRSVMEGGSFPCHETVQRDDDDEYIPGAEGERDCVGLDIVMLREELTGQMLRIRERIGVLDPARLLARSRKVQLWTWDEIQEDGEEEGETCAISGTACEAPAGWMIGGSVVRGTTYIDTICPLCGEFICDTCMDDADHECVTNRRGAPRVRPEPEPKRRPSRA